MLSAFVLSAGFGGSGGRNGGDRLAGLYSIRFAEFGASKCFTIIRLKRSWLQHRDSRASRLHLRPALYCTSLKLLQMLSAASGSA